MPLKNFLDGKLTPEIGVSFFWKKLRSNQIEFSDILGASFKLGASWELIARFKVGLMLTLDLGNLDNLTLDDNIYVLEQPVNIANIYLSLFTGIRLF